MAKNIECVNKKRQSRTKKSGWVYLLESEEFRTFKDGSKAKTYKYGATTKHFAERCRKINYTQEMNFRPIAAFKSNDIYADENIVAYGLLDGGFAKMSEYVCCNQLTDSLDAKKRFLSFATKYSEDGKRKRFVIWEEYA